MNREHVIAMIVGAGAMLLFVLLFLPFQYDSKPDCEEMAAEMWATRSCLALQPACQGLTQEQFMKYHKIRNRFEEQCGADRGDDWLSQSIESNGNGKE